jgi:hypothetical protein
MTRLTVDDARKAGFCCKGQRKWAKRVGIDMHAFVRDGIDVSELGHINDAKLTKAISIARTRELTDGR